jgi:hypothetical protein
MQHRAPGRQSDLYLRSQWHHFTPHLGRFGGAT